MVRALHQAGLEVILDVVFNHTAKGGQAGPSLCYRGLDNPAYHRLVDGNPREYYDTTGTGNSLNAGNPVTLRLIMDSLRYWLTEMHVDGFRFDLAATLARQEGGFSPMSAFFDMVAQDPVVSQAKLIAEPWDVGQLDSYDRAGSRCCGTSGTAATGTACGTSGAARGRAASASSPPGSPAHRTCMARTAAARAPRST